ncbi:hypothetical protein BO221_36040 [Archangium sp. Cb G35]|uniref:hypothetical protein n=1 Tax=Archangium sp. Cb G35 TaxID=1920190 RepID=UPI000936347D|nr:hypothetical protein [Archangium sp. Cb G35]OJT19752.1 hypothetical protein BO221_36040 [Archangium sp. Cb G35]
MLFTQLSFARLNSPYVGLEAAYRTPLATEGRWNHVLVGGGLRVARKPALPEFTDITLPLEVFLQARLRARVGPWEPSVGPELGLSGMSVLYRRIIPAEGEDPQEQSRLSPFYFAIGAAPLRFHFGRFTVSALEFHVGTVSFPHNSAVRLQLGLLHGGIQL